MLLIGRGDLALAYLAGSIFCVALPFIASNYGLLQANPADIWWVPALLTKIVGAAHAALIQRNVAFMTARKWYASWPAAFGLGVILPIILPLMMKLFLFESYHAASVSMLPTLRPEEDFFVSKTAYSVTHTPQLGDIVIFAANGRAQVKRIVGLPGDKVQMKDGILLINEKPVKRKYIKEEDFADPLGRNVTYKRYKETLPDGYEHDIYEISDDAPLDNTEPFTVPDNQYFMMGDNRDQSLDSRAGEEVGFVEQQQIIGKAAYIYWNTQEKQIHWRAIK